MAGLQEKTSLDKGKIKILLLEGVHEARSMPFGGRLYRNRTASQVARGGGADATARDAYFIGIRSATQLTARVIEAAPRLIGIGCFCIGTNQVDLDAAQDRGIPVFNAPFSNTRSVAELVLAEISPADARHSGAQRGGASRRVGEDRRRIARSARQDTGHRRIRAHRDADRLAGRGGGHAGGLLRYRDQAGAGQCAARWPSLDALLEIADVVTLHVPETPQTAGMIGAARLARMKPGAKLINASRGTVVDIDALAEALRSEHISAARRSTCFPRSRRAPAMRSSRRLRGFDNVILTPHIGGSTEEAQAEHRHRGGGEADQVQQQRVHADGA